MTWAADRPISENCQRSCTPIKMGENIIGVIGLVAFTEEQREILLDKEEKHGYLC